MTRRVRLTLAVLGLASGLGGCPPPAAPPPAAPPPAAPPPAAPPPAAPPPESLDPVERLEAPAPLPTGRDTTRPRLTPPFAGPGVLLESYEFGGIAGRGTRVRVTAEEAVLFAWDKERVRAALTEDERKELAALVASLGPVEWHSSDRGVADGQSSGLYVAGTGRGGDGTGGPARDLARRLERRLDALARAGER